MVIGHEITHGFDDNGEKTAEKVLFLQLPSSHCKRFRLHTAGPGAPSTPVHIPATGGNTSTLPTFH